MPKSLFGVPVDSKGKPLSNPDLPRLRRTKKDATTIARGKEAGRLLRLQLNALGTTLETISEDMNLPVKTTLANHIRSGNVTLSELCLIYNFFPVDVNSILERMRDPHVANMARVAKMSARGMIDTTNSATAKAPVSSLSDEDRETAASLGLDWINS